MFRKRTWRAQNVFALIPIVCVAGSLIMCGAGRVLIAEDIARFWILCLGVLSSLISTHLYIAWRLGNKYAFPRTLMPFAWLSLATASVWFLIAFAVVFALATTSHISHGQELISIFEGTIGLPVQLTDWLGSAPSFNLLDLSSGMVYSFAITVSSIYLLDLLLMAVYSKFRV